MNCADSLMKAICLLHFVQMLKNIPFEFIQMVKSYAFKYDAIDM
jgi:hypothetical protein